MLVSGEVGVSSEAGHVGVVGHEHSLHRDVLVGVVVIDGGVWVHGRHVGIIGIPCVGDIVGNNPSAVPSAMKFPASVCMCLVSRI